MSLGWVSIHRKINDCFLHPNQEKRKFTKYEAWIDLILRAAHKEYEVLINSSCVKLNKGEIVTSESRLAELWGWDRQTVKRFLITLKKKSMLSSHKLHENNYKSSTILKLNNYATYQSNGVSDATMNATTLTTTNATQYNNVNNFNKKGFSQIFYNEGLVPDEI